MVSDMGDANSSQLCTPCICTNQTTMLPALAIQAHCLLSLSMQVMEQQTEGGHSDVNKRALQRGCTSPVLT